jgi:predicted amidophosphoribosyltransferase
MPGREFEPTGIMGQQIFGLPVDREILFSNHKKIYKKRIEKRQRKLIVKIHFLKPFLKRGEKILLVTTGYSPLASAAQYLTGFLFVYLKRCLFVFTNYRVLHIPVTPAYKYKNAIAQIAYAGCRSLALKGGTLVADYGKLGKSEKFRGVPVSERRKIKMLLGQLPISGTDNDTADRIHLCPNCTHRLEAGKYVCENCRQKFKSKLAARIIAVIMPGGGYFYTRHYLIGALNALLEVLLISYLVYIAVTSGIPQKNVKESLYYMVPLALIYLTLKIISVIHATHFIDEFIPKEKLLKPNGNSRANPNSN